VVRSAWASLPKTNQRSSPGGDVAAGETRLISALIDPTGEPARWLIVRNGAGVTASEGDVLAVFAGDVPSVHLTDGEIALALRDPVAASVSCARRTWPENVIAVVGPSGVPLHVNRPRAPLRLPPPRALWSGADGTVALDVPKTCRAARGVPTRGARAARGCAAEGLDALLPSNERRPCGAAGGSVLSRRGFERG
jgi:hypothetical protein